MNLISVIQSLWDRITSVSDKAAIKVLIAIVIGYFIVNGSKQQDEKDITIKNLRQDNKDLRGEIKEWKNMLLTSQNEKNAIYREVAVGKDTIIAKLTKALKEKK